MPRTRKSSGSLQRAARAPNVAADGEDHDDAAPVEPRARGRPRGQASGPPGGRQPGRRAHPGRRPRLPQEAGSRSAAHGRARHAVAGLHERKPVCAGVPTHRLERTIRGPACVRWVCGRRDRGSSMARDRSRECRSAPVPGALRSGSNMGVDSRSCLACPHARTGLVCPGPCSPCSCSPCCWCCR